MYANPSGVSPDRRTALLWLAAAGAHGRAGGRALPRRLIGGRRLSQQVG